MRFRLPRISDARDYILTALILVFAISIMILRHDGGMQNIQKASITVLSYLEQPLSTIRVYRQALNTNTYLQRQNALLQDEISRLRAAERENRILRNLLDFREDSEYGLLPITIVSKDLTSLNNSLTISAGSEQGVRTGMPIINSDGLIGQVTVTTGRYAQVMPLIHSLSRISARIQESRAYGIVSWEGNRYNELIMQHVPETIEAEAGQVVETSGFSNQFPPNIPIGEITRIEHPEGIDTQLIYIRPFVTFHTVAKGFVVEFEPDPDIEELHELEQELF